MSSSPIADDHHSDSVDVGGSGSRSPTPTPSDHIGGGEDDDTLRIILNNNNNNDNSHHHSSDPSSSHSDNSSSSSSSIGIKLFVGQLGQHTNEEDLRSLFSQFGTILSTVVLRDKARHQSKGCGFVTMSSQSEADASIEALHDKHKVPGGKRELIVNIANKEKAKSSIPPLSSSGPSSSTSSHYSGGPSGRGPPSSRFDSSHSFHNNNNNNNNNAGGGSDDDNFKLYVSHLSRSSTTDDVRELFGRYGEVKEVHLMKAADGSSRGAGFVKMARRSDAELAMEMLNNKYNDKNESVSIQVKWAHSKTPSPANRFQSPKNAQPPAVTNPLNNPAALQATMMTAMNPSDPMAAMNAMNQMMAMMAAGGMGMPGMSGMSGMGNMGNMGNMAAMNAAMNPLMMMSMMNPAAMGMPNMPMNPMMGMGAMPFSAPSTSSNTNTGGGSGGASTNTRAPDGANLFVHNIPLSYTEPDLLNLFGPYGRVLSTRVQRDTNNRSRGFGFVSFDDVGAAHQAIKALDGSMIQGRKISVRPKEDKSKPY